MSERAQRCKYPGCRVTAKTTWALVPVCTDHKEMIRIEAIRYYRGQGKSERPHYSKIETMIPWSQLRLGRMK